MKEISVTGRNNLWAAVSMLTLSILAVALRIGVRLAARIPSTLSDWLILVSLALTTTYCSFIIRYVVAGKGPGTFDQAEILANAANGGTEWGIDLLKSIYVSDIFFGLAITFIKLSILAFYYDIFSISKLFQIWTKVVAGLCIAWLIAYTFLNVFQCHPISALWDAFGSTEYCIASGRLWLGYELTNLFLDVFVLVLPVVMVHRLRLPTVQRWSVSGIFLLGGLVCVSSIVRLVFVWDPKQPDLVGNISDTLVTASIQLGTATLCACLPTYSALGKFLSCAGARKIRKSLGTGGSQSQGSTQKSRSRGLLSDTSASRDLENTSYRRVDGDATWTHHRTLVTGNSGESYTLEALPSQSIMVQKSVEVGVV